ncbi:pericentriolar material 1 protein isoform X3 [Aethina tumida]|uniref:pericentriolar material 1 protein isoform X3 n=1 Tax=Aethina tumida TaxID=116153 RepID=UPI002147B4F7|nr:pericentriolar material 1 protein isoform X3 [Aethina tumida]
MSEERRKTNKHGTGTVPKVKYRINTPYSHNPREPPRSLTNNLASDVHHSDYTNFIRNPRRDPRNNYYMMDTSVEEHNQNFNSLINTNGHLTPNSSSSTSRRNSSTLKCDNVTKYPDKKQIEDKLSQIREYLRITSSLMATMKNTDDQLVDDTELESLTKMMKDLYDSEAKLVDILDSMEQEENRGVQIVEVNGDNGSEPSTSSSTKNDHNRHDADQLKEEQLTLLKLQQKAENKLKDARLAQEKMLLAQAVGNQSKNVSTKRENNCMSEEDFDEAIRVLEERAKRLNGTRPPPNSNFEDKFLAEVDALQNQIMIMHDANEERSQLIEVLDNRDAELRSQHVELQNKLMDLQNKKQQVDQLVAQLNSIDGAEEDDNDVGCQVRRIVTMKDQLNKLKDMLEIVKTTENVVQNSNGSQEANELACDVCTKAENFLLNDFQNIKTRPNTQNDSNMLRYDNNTMSDNRQKQVNKNTREQSRGAKSRTSSINELEAKKRELEDLMGKHKAGTSNLNHDIGADSKSEFSCTNSLNEAGWVPLSHLPSQSISSNHLSSDECQEDVNEYSEIAENQNHIPMQSFNFSPPNTVKHRTHNQPRIEYPSSNYEGSQRFSCTPERNVRSSSVTTPTYVRERPRSNTEQKNKCQVKKQLQLIKRVCESMLEQQTPNNNNQQANVQVRNNLTPSPLYSEPRRFASPNSNPLNTVNVVNPVVEPPWLTNGAPQPDMNGYNGWLATNTLQTQSFMLNTLNQCCQMLWIQQRELQNLRNAVSMLQDQMENLSVDTNAQQQQQQQQQHHQRAPPPNPSNLYRPSPSPKVNHVAAACSMPNLNHYNAAPPSNLDLSYINSASCLNNNANHHMNAGPSSDNHHQTNNAALHANINPLPGQLWNGQALNNQVPPGNRANNYWDNFRSYSRQNLLSTKNSDVLSSSGLDRFNTSTSDRSNPFTLMTLSKSNSEHESTSTSQENTPQRRLPFRHNETTANNNSAIPPDVLNVNNNGKFGDGQPPIELDKRHRGSMDDLQLGFQMLLNSYHDESSNQSNVSEEREAPPLTRRRNEWNNDTHGEQTPKTKLFDDLRENVYKEVASLISANEARPHFLIQLFRDLQMIGSDSLRTKILQSIQNVITHSLTTNPNRNRLQTSESQPVGAESLPHNRTESFSLQSTVWTKTRKNSTQRNLINMEHVENDVQSAFKGVTQFLNENNDMVIDHDFVNIFKKKLLDSESFQEVLSDSVFLKHFSNVLNEVLEQYQGKKLSEVKAALLQSLGDLLRSELSFIQLIQETSPENCPLNLTSDSPPSSVHFKFPELQNNNSNSPQLHNGDLAEADQSRGEEDEAEEEGAVGGYLELPQENSEFHMVQAISEELDVPTIDFANNAEGLDQVPTRLPTNTRSRSTTPNRDPSRGDPDNF